MPSRAVAAAVAAAVLALAACSGDGAPARVERGTLEWAECGNVECATLEVPLDHDRPDGPTIELALARRRADGDPVGALVTNPGGPGASGVEMIQQAGGYFSAAILDRFDVVSWDPRGVGASAAVDCLDDLDWFYAVDRSPEDDAEVQENVDAARRLADACADGNAELLPHLSTRATVRDLEAIRVALGEEQLTYLGFSYGTYVGALYAEAYPDRVRAMVLDGAVDPTLSLEQASRDQALGFEAALGAFLDDCARRGCGFGGDDPRSAFTMLAELIDAETLPATVDGEERLLGPGELDLGVAAALYAGEDGWELLARGLREAAQGDAAVLLALSDAYTGREPGGGYSNQGEAFYAIGCLDAPAPPVEDFPAIAAAVAGDAPFFGATTVWLGLPCAVWPVDPDGGIGPIAAPGSPPLVVIGTANDPATPLHWAEALASQLESGVLVVYEGEGHTAYSRGDACVDRVVERYLRDLVVPADGTRCPDA